MSTIKKFFIEASALIFLGLLSWFLVDKLLQIHKQHNVETTIDYKKITQELEYKNDSLNKVISIQKYKIDESLDMIDSLNNLKQQTQVIYVKQKDKVDHLTPTNVVKQLDTIFTKAGIR